MVCLGLATTGLAPAASLPAVSRQPASCAGEVARMRGVWRSPQVFMPAYGDWELVLYLASLGPREQGVAVLPVFSSEPIYFRSSHIVFLSTGFILKAASENELLEAIRNAPPEVRTGDLPACSAMLPSTTVSFSDIQRRLTEQLAGYPDVTVRRLRIRNTNGQ